MSTKSYSEQATDWQIKLFDLRREFMRAHNAGDDRKAREISRDIETVERHIVRLEETERGA